MKMLRQSVGVQGFFENIYNGDLCGQFSMPNQPTSIISETSSNHMNDTTQLPPLPDRLSVDPRSRYHNADVLQHEIGIKLNDKEYTNAEEYCISEGWIAVASGKAKDRKGNPLMIKLKGKVEAFYR